LTAEKLLFCIAGLITDRTIFIKLVRQESKRFHPLGKFICEFTR